MTALQAYALAALEDISLTILRHSAYLVDIIVLHAAAQYIRHAQAVFLILTLLLIVLACVVIPSAPLAAELQPHAPVVCQAWRSLLVSATLPAPKIASPATAPLA